MSAASAILQTMDQSVEPCDDFYQYACGGWIKNTIVPEGKSLWGTFGIIEQQNQRIIKIILGQCLPKATQIYFLGKTGKWFKCIMAKFEPVVMYD